MFELNIEKEENSPEFKYVYLKIIKLKNHEQERVLIQIIDMSHKMLYNEVKAEQHFSMLMNGAVSHELRNPLYALVGGIDSLKYYLANLR